MAPSRAAILHLPQMGYSSPRDTMLSSDGDSSVMLWSVFVKGFTVHFARERLATPIHPARGHEVSTVIEL